MLCAVSVSAQVRVDVTNTAGDERTGEMVELEWKRLASRIEGLTPDNVVVSFGGVQVPSQVLTEGENAPQGLIFMVDRLAPSATASYKVDKGVRKDYAARAYGRFVPERKDDYAWENDIVAFRIYGPALRVELVTGGVDYWAKNTSELVIDKWYERDLAGRGSYHLDHGQGCDCYKVGPTLGAGSSVFVDGDKLVPGENFESWERLDNGPLRTTVRLFYAPVAVGGREVRMVKDISLDAGSYFNRVSEKYIGAAGKEQVMVGMVVHKDAKIARGSDYVCLFEPASDSQSKKDGSIGCAVIVPKGGRDFESVASTGENQIGKLVNGRSQVYYTGAASSKGGVVNNIADWERVTLDKAMSLKHPLKVKIRR